MSYIGNQVTSVPHIVDIYNGNGVTTSFGTLARAPAGVAAIAVFVSGAYQVPGIDYTLNGSVITFTVAPATGVNNVVIHHLGNGTTTQVPSDGSVTGTKLAVNAIRGNNIVAGTIIGNLIGTGAIAGNNIVAGTITGNLIADNAISANHFSSSANTKIISSGLVGSIIFGA